MAEHEQEHETSGRSQHEQIDLPAISIKSIQGLDVLNAEHAFDRGLAFTLWTPRNS